MRAARTPAAPCRRVGRKLRSASPISGGAQTKPERYPVIDERFESVLKTTTFVRSATCSAETRRLVEPQLRVRLVRAEQKAVLAGARRQAPRRTRAARPRRSGCSDSRPRRARSRPTRRTHRRSGSQPFSSFSGSVATEPPAKSAPRSYTGYAGSGIATTRLSPSAIWANEKIASFEPSVGTISLRRIDRDAEAALDPACDRCAQLRQPGRARVRRDGLDRRGQRLADERRRHFARIAHAEVDQLDPFAVASAFQSSRRAKGYCASSVSTGERRIA